MNMFAVETPFGFASASWQHVDGMIVVRDGQREGKTTATGSQSGDAIVAYEMVRGWIKEDLRKPASPEGHSGDFEPEIRTELREEISKFREAYAIAYAMVEDLKKSLAEVRS